jgi:hypothetical protein
VSFLPKWADLKKSAEWRAEGSFSRDDPRFEGLRRNYLTTSALEAYGLFAFAALIALFTILLLAAILGEHFFG